ncbi:MAG: hypothetical protein FJZ16_10415 [Candidatus Omnitrophica bacterium]|nr:hypothetical protein [Candidatus Omnitrophota bacterium]MBM4135710.1 hypothetical protein [Nitrospira sp.]
MGLSATKVFTTGEGGLFVTNKAKIAEKVMELRNYGLNNSLPHYDCEDLGLNGKMTELGAVIGLKNLETIDQMILRRNEVSELYKRNLKKIPGIIFQEITANSKCTFKDFPILIDEKFFGLNRDELSIALDKEKVETKKYFYLPIHKMKVYSNYENKYRGFLPHTEFVSQNILCLPIYSHMPSEVVEKICFAIERIHQHSQEIKKCIKDFFNNNDDMSLNILEQKSHLVPIQ